jgi:hypothetical protein
MTHGPRPALERKERKGDPCTLSSLTSRYHKIPDHHVKERRTPTRSQLERRKHTTSNIRIKKSRERKPVRALTSIPPNMVTWSRKTMSLASLATASCIFKLSKRRLRYQVKQVIRAQDNAKLFDKLSDDSQTFTRLRKAAASTAQPQACRPSKKNRFGRWQTRRTFALNGHLAGFWGESRRYHSSECSSHLGFPSLSC